MRRLPQVQTMAGMPSKVSINVGSTYCDMIGTMMKKPHMP